MIDNDIITENNKGEYEFYSQEDMGQGLLGNVDDEDWKI